MNARPAERGASGSHLEGSEDYCLGRLKPKFEFRIYHGASLLSHRVGRSFPGPPLEMVA